MPVVRIDPAPGKGKKRTAAQSVGAIIGKTFGGPGLVLFAAKMGDAFGKLVSKKEPVFPFEVDTDTNKLTVLTPDWGKAVNTKTRKLAPKLEARTQPIRDALQAVWDTGEIPGTLPKRYRTVASELLQQRAILFRESEPAPVSPIETTGAQYTGEYSMAGFVPPGGFAGFAQMTPASKYAQGLGRLGKLAKRLTRGRKKRKAKKAGGKRKRRAKGGKKARLVKGSAAAKRYMAALRRKRK